MPVSRRIALSVLIFFLAVPAFAKEWWESYADGVKAARNGDWGTVVARMNEAIAKMPSENDRARPYGTIFVKYHPYYYRGVANFKLGNYREAVSDLKRATGVGEYPAGDINDLLDRANEKLSGPPPTTTRETPPPPPPTTTRENPPPTTTQPHVNPPPTNPGEVAAQQARARAESMLKDTERRTQAAVRANAVKYDPTNFKKAESLWQQAINLRASARSADDWNRIADLADTAGRTYDAATTAARIAAVSNAGKIDQAADAALSNIRTPLKAALRDYFGGNFDRSATTFKQLTSGVGSDYPLLWAFQGAALYYSYYLEGSSNKAKRDEAAASFRQAKRLNPRMKSLPTKYFSPRVRRFFETVQ